MPSPASNLQTMSEPHLDPMAEEMASTIPAGLLYSFESQAKQYAKSGRPGISHLEIQEELRLHPGRPFEIHALLYRNSKGRVIGILNYYPVDVPPYERAGNVNIWVHPQRQRRGIATKLLDEALRIWPTIDAAQQRYSPSGLALVTKLLGRDPRTPS